jgi:hypothetical protein
MKPNETMKPALDHQFHFTESQHWISIATINYCLAYEIEQNKTAH